MGGESREGWIPFFRRQWDDFTAPAPAAPPVRRMQEGSWEDFSSGIKGLGSNLYKAGSDLLSNPVDTITNYGTKWWNKNKTDFADTGEKVLGRVGAVTTAPVAKMASTMWDVADPRNSGSEKKPVSDVLWEGAKTAYAGLKDPKAPQPELARELGTRVGPGILEDMKSRDPLGYQVTKFGLNNVDTTNLGAVHGLTGAVGAAAHIAGMGSHLAQEAAIPMWLAKQQQNIKRFSHGSPVEKDIESMIEHGFRGKTGYDVLERYAHAGMVSPQQAEAAHRAGIQPLSNVADPFGTYQMPVDFPDNMLALNLFEPVPKEDIQDIVARLHPVRDKAKIDSIWRAWQAQSHLVVDPADQISGKIPFKSIRGTPGQQLVRNLETELAEGAVHGIRGKGGASALNHPDMPTAANSRWGATFYHDTAASDAKSLAFDPNAAMVTDPSEKNPWKPLGTYPGLTFPRDLGDTTPVKAGLWKPARETNKAAEMADHVNDIKTTLQDHGVSVDPNSPLGKFLGANQTAQAQVDPKTAHKLASNHLKQEGKFDAAYEIDDLWENKIQANGDIADKANNFHWDVVNNPTATDAAKADAWHALDPKAQQAYKSLWPDEYGKNIKAPAAPATAPSTSTLPNAPTGSPSGTQDWMQKHPNADEHYITQVANGVHDPANSEDDLAELFNHQLNAHEAHALQVEFPSEYKKYKAAADKVYGAPQALPNVMSQHTQSAANNLAEAFHNNISSDVNLHSKDVAKAFENLAPEGQEAYKAMYPDTYNHLKSYLSGAPSISQIKSSPIYQAQEFKIQVAQNPGIPVADRIAAWHKLPPEVQQAYSTEFPQSYANLNNQINALGLHAPVAPPTTKKIDVHAGTPISQAVSDIQQNTSLNAQVAAYNKLSPEDQAVHAYNYPNTNKKITAAIQAPPPVAPPTKASPAAVVKHDVFDPGNGQTLATFNSEQEAKDWMAKHPNSQYLDIDKHDPNYPKHKDFQDFTTSASTTTAEAPKKWQGKSLPTGSQATVHHQAGILQKLENGVGDPGNTSKYAKDFWEGMFESERNAFQDNYPDLYNKYESTLKGSVKAPDDGWGNFNKAWKDKYPNSDQKYIESIADTIKNSAYDQEAFADVFANDLNGPDSYALKQEYPELWQKLKDAHDAEFGKPSVPYEPELPVVAPKSVEPPLAPVEAPKAPTTLESTQATLEKTWHSLLGKDSNKTLEEKISLWEKIPEGSKEIYRKYLPDEVAKLESGVVAAPKVETPKVESLKVESPIKSELPDSWKQFTKTEAKPKLDDPIKVLKEKYPELAEHFAGHSGTEMGSIESHTNDVLKEWKTQISSKEISGIGSRFGHEVEGLLERALPLHDIGKAEAIKAGNKANQHKHTIPIMQDILKKEGYNEKEIALATELFNHDLLGSAVQGHGSPEQLKKAMIDKANKVGMNSADFARLQMAVYESDAASYPFITQYMKKEGDRWTFKGNKNLTGIEELINPSAAKEAKYTVKERNANLVGYHKKDIFTKDGKDYIFKPAVGASYAQRPYIEKNANDIANLAGMHPIDISVEKKGGILGSMQGMVGNRSDWPTLKGKKIEKLSTEQLTDIIKNHPVDWLTGNHDAHGGQFLMTDKGIVEIDRGQAFKFYGDDKLHPTYQPPELAGDDPTIYQQIHKLRKEGKLPQLSDDAIANALEETINNINKNSGKITEHMADSLTRLKKDKHIDSATKRLNNLSDDLRKFWK